MPNLRLRAWPAVALLWTALCAPVQAHEKWLIPGDEVRRLQSEPRPAPLNRFFPEIAGSLLAAAALVGAGFAVDRYFRKRRVGEALCRRLLAMRKAAPPLVGVTTGIVLVVAGLTRTFIAPDLRLDAALPPGAALAVAGAQIALGAAFILGAWTRAAALALLVLFIPSAALWGLRSWMDYLDVVGFAVYLGIAGRGALSVDSLRGVPAPSPSQERNAVSLLRVILGLNLAVLAINNKLFNPLVSMKIVADWNLNFPKRLGFAWHTDAHYVLAAAAVEIAIGVLFVLGVTTRLLSIAVFALLVTTFCIFGFVELIGHLPILAGGVAVLMMGTGGRLWYGQPADEPGPAVATTP